jgi:hypothetical protein
MSDAQKLVEDALENSSVLQTAANQLSAELAGRVNKYKFDPLLIISIVGIIINVIIHCRDEKSDDDLYDTITDIEQIPPRKVMRLRRQLNKLWREHHPAAPRLIRRENPYTLAVYQTARQLPRRTFNKLIAVAKQEVERRSGKKKNNK